MVLLEHKHSSREKTHDIRTLARNSTTNDRHLRSISEIQRYCESEVRINDCEGTGPTIGRQVWTGKPIAASQPLTTNMWTVELHDHKIIMRLVIYIADIALFSALSK